MYHESLTAPVLASAAMQTRSWASMGIAAGALLALAGCAALLGGDDDTPAGGGDGGSSSGDGGGGGDDGGGGGAVDAGVPLVDAMPGTLAVGALADVRVPRGAFVDVTITISRGSGVSGAVTVSVTGLPSGVSASTLTIDPGDNTGVVRVTAAANASTASALATVHAEAAGGVSDTTSWTVAVPPPPGAAEGTWADGGRYDVPGAFYGHFVVEGDQSLRGACVSASQLNLFHVPADGVDADVLTAGDDATGVDGVTSRPGGGWVVLFHRAGGEVLLRAYATNGNGVAGFGYATIGVHKGLARYDDGWVLIDVSTAPSNVQWSWLRRTDAAGALDPTWTRPPQPATPQAEIFDTLAVSGASVFVGGYVTYIASGGRLSSGPAFVGKAGSGGQVGRVVWPFTDEWIADDVAATASGNVIVALSDRGLPNAKITLLAYTPAGQVATTFSVPAGLVGRARDIAVMPDGRVVVATAQQIARFTSTGALDTSFGTGGLVTLGGLPIANLELGDHALYVGVAPNGGGTGGAILKLAND